MALVTDLIHFLAISNFVKKKLWTLNIIPKFQYLINSLLLKNKKKEFKPRLHVEVS